MTKFRVNGKMISEEEYFADDDWYWINKGIHEAKLKRIKRNRTRILNIFKRLNITDYQENNNILTVIHNNNKFIIGLSKFKIKKCGYDKWYYFTEKFFTNNY